MKNNMMIPLCFIGLKNVDYVVLTTLLDKDFGIMKNKSNYAEIEKHIYLERKQEMIKSTGNMEDISTCGENKKPLSIRQWDRNFKKLKELGIVKEMKDANGKVYKYCIYNKSLKEYEYIIVETEMIRTLRKSYKSTAIKIYLYLRKECFNYKTKNFETKVIPLVKICEALGLSHNTRADVLLILHKLHASGYIRIYENIRKTEKIKQHNVSYYEYEIVDYEEWKRTKK